MSVPETSLMTQALCSLLLALDALVGTVQALCGEGDLAPYQVMQLELARELLSKVQASTWKMCEAVDKVIAEESHNV